jgi:AcrR family transcriptional regulator
VTAAEKRKKPVKAGKIDHRIVRTRDRLGDALIALMHEKDFEDITVQDVLDRTRVSRSTFYVHYSDKDDLFLSDVEDFLENASTALKRQRANPTRLLPVAELFSHIRDARHVYIAFVKSGKIHDFRVLGLGMFARSIDERLRAACVQLDATAISAHAHALAGSFFSLLDWWIDKGMKTDPRQMDELFHGMAWRGLTRRASNDEDSGLLCSRHLGSGF